MFKSREEELVLKKHRRQQMLKMFRETLTKVSNLNQTKLHINVSAMFQGEQFVFDITVFNQGGGNTSLMIYDFWEVKQSQKLVDSLLTAIKTGDFEKVKIAARGKL